MGFGTPPVVQGWGGSPSADRVEVTGLCSHGYIACSESGRLSRVSGGGVSRLIAADRQSVISRGDKQIAAIIVPGLTGYGNNVWVRKETTCNILTDVICRSDCCVIYGGCPRKSSLGGTQDSGGSQAARLPLSARHRGARNPRGHTEYWLPWKPFRLPRENPWLGIDRRCCPGSWRARWLSGPPPQLLNSGRSH